MNQATSSRTILVIVGIGAALIILIIGLYISSSEDSGKYDQFAKCIEQSGAVFYGAFWCPHCQNQKKMFGSSAKYLPYVECSTPDGRGQTTYCDEKGVDGYPLWGFSDGSKLSGEVSLSTLADKTGCSIYEIATSTATSTQ